MHHPYAPRDLATEMTWLWACLTSDVGGLVEEHPRMKLCPTCPQDGRLGPFEELEMLRVRAQAGYLILREMARECAASRGLSLDEYLAEKGRNLARLAADTAA